MKKIKRLLFSLTANCNLRCRYCYVFHDQIGCFSTPAMSSETIKKAVKKIYGNCTEAGFVQFFGGEPNLALENMKTAVLEISRICRERGINPPRFGIITNLTILDDEILAFYKNNNLQITVSFDGPKTIHDDLRSYRTGGGTHDDIVANFKKLKAAELAYSIEATFTGRHLAKNITVIDLLEYFDELGASRADIVAVMNNRDADLNVYEKNYLKIEKLFSEAIDYWFAYRQKGGKMIFGIAAEIISLIAQKDQNNYCPAGESYLAVAADGKIYPCHLFIGNEKYLLGDAESAEPLLAMPSGGGENKLCKVCPVSSVCFSCKGKNEYYNYDSNRPFAPDCRLKQKIISKVIDDIKEIIKEK